MDTDTNGLNEEQSAVSEEQSAVSSQQSATAEENIETTEAKRTGKKNKSRNRQTQAELQKTLALKKCRHCLSVGLWKIVSTQGRIRYIRCQACGRTDQVATEK